MRSQHNVRRVLLEAPEKSSVCDGLLQRVRSTEPRSETLNTPLVLEPDRVATRRDGLPVDLYAELSKQQSITELEAAVLEEEVALVCELASLCARSSLKRVTANQWSPTTDDGTRTVVPDGSGPSAIET